MLRHRLLRFVLAVLTALAVAGPAAADEPTVKSTGGPPSDEPWIPPTPAQQESLDLRLAQLGELQATQKSLRGTTAQNGFCETSPAAGAPSASGDDCAPPSYNLLTYARRQYTDWYCGPATAQVIINYTRGIFKSKLGGQDPDTNYKKQTYIATRLLWWNAGAGRWENTDTIGQTNAYMLANGLNELAKRPNRFEYAVVATGTGSEWHAKVIEDVQDWHMPFGAGVKMTHDSQRLSSWSPIPEGVEVHHWITIRGYTDYWDGTNGPKVWFNDSSDRQGGGTGTFWDPSIKVWSLNTWHTNRVVW